MIRKSDQKLSAACCSHKHCHKMSYEQRSVMCLDPAPLDPETTVVETYLTLDSFVIHRIFFAGERQPDRGTDSGVQGSVFTFR